MLGMPLLLFDLDNTLLPRDAAFRAWAQDFLSEHDLPPGDVEWFVTLDGSGYVPRSTVLSAVRRRYGLDASVEFLLAHFRRGINSHIRCPSGHIAALEAARAAGWTLGIVSNGGTRPQLEKIRRTGLGALVDGWVISEEADCVKPDPLIFEIAARRCGVAPTGDWTAHTWMVGDHAPADIAGAELSGLRSVWLHHGRPWSEIGYRPTLKAAGLPEAVGQVLSARTAPSLRPGIRAGGAAKRRIAGAPARATAPLGARSGAHSATAAPDGPGAPVAANAGPGGAPGAGAGSGVRNRSGGFAVLADKPPRAGAGAGSGTRAGAATGAAPEAGPQGHRAAAAVRPTPLRATGDGTGSTPTTGPATAPVTAPAATPATPATAAVGGRSGAPRTSPISAARPTPITEPAAVAQ
ncbi:HAD family hydrolase [Streptomyces sp. Y1]|uniref:HAD family hydrolase n=1 Tax=Streptomyces sp. Y1 TaxID=3238634 RepID=A0AB39TNJ8_9ACTN